MNKFYRELKLETSKNSEETIKILTEDDSIVIQFEESSPFHKGVTRIDRQSQRLPRKVAEWIVENLQAALEFSGQPFVQIGEDE